MEELMPIIISLLAMSSSTMPALSGAGTGNKPDCIEENASGSENEIINLLMKYGLNSSNKLKINEIDIVLIIIIVILLSSNSKTNDMSILNFLPILSSIMQDS